MWLLLRRVRHVRVATEPPCVVCSSLLSQKQQQQQQQHTTTTTTTRIIGVDINNNNNKISIYCINCLYLKLSSFELSKIKIRFDVVPRVSSATLSSSSSFAIAAMVRQHKQQISNRDGPCHLHGYNDNNRKSIFVVATTCC